MTLAFAAVLVERCKVVAKRPVPLDERVARALWWTTVNCGVVPARAAEGHVTVARLRSTTLSARHQVVNRWDMPSQATFVKPSLRAPTTLHSQ